MTRAGISSAIRLIGAVTAVSVVMMLFAACRPDKTSIPDIPAPDDSDIEETSASTSGSSAYEPELMTLNVALPYQESTVRYLASMYYAKKNNYVLLTGDRKLRTASVLDGVEVHGTIYVLDNLVACGLLSHADAIDKLNLLYNTNPRLPQEEKAKRINLWKSEMSKKGDCL